MWKFYLMCSMFRIRFWELPHILVCATDWWASHLTLKRPYEGISTLKIKKQWNSNYSNNKDLLYSTGTSTRISMTYMGKESKNEWTDVYIQLNPFAVWWKLTQHCKSTTFREKKEKINRTSKRVSNMQDTTVLISGGTGLKLDLLLGQSKTPSPGVIPTQVGAL